MVTSEDVRRKARLALITRADSPLPAKVDREQLRRYWTETPEGLAKWADKPHPWTALRNHLRKYLPPGILDRVVSDWHFRVFHQHTGSDAYRIEHGGKEPRRIDS